MRIGELSARTGVNAATLRAWERRYGLLRPTRTEGGQRIYSEEDVVRVAAAVALVNAGVRVSDAVARLSAPQEDVAAGADELRRGLWESVDEFDEKAAAAVLFAATTGFGIPLALDAVIVPVLRRLGAEWRASPRNVGREHFASTLVRGHLVRLLSSTPTTERAGLAFCPEGEQHDIGLVMASLTLATTGRPHVVVGANTPLASIELLLTELRPPVVLVAAATRRPVVRFLARWRAPAGCRIVAGGMGFRAGDEARLGGSLHHGPYAALPTALGAVD
jgi:DNA-binding transcriptional MerR regulator